MHKYADLHVHSDYSDSNSSLEEVFSNAKKMELSCISITDHDTVAGIEPAFFYAQKYNIELIAGIEISAEYNDSEIHILGFFVDYKDTGFIKALEELREVRYQRILKMSDNLTDIGLKVDKEELLSRFIAHSVPTRLHLAQYMIEKGYVNSLWEAFKKYLSPKCEVYESRFRFSVKESIKLISQAKGLSFLAHPHHLSKNKNIVKEFVDYGLCGIEVKYPRYDVNTVKKFSSWAAQFGILRSGGSDCHGSFKEHTSIGETKIDYQWVEKIKEHHKKLYRQNYAGSQ